MKNIVCPIDFSESANNAIEYAGHLAKLFGAKLTLLHIAEEPEIMKESSAHQELAVLREKMDQYKRTVETNFLISCETIVRDFTPTIENALGSMVETGGYDLVVMGTGGTREISQFFLGTNTSGLIRKTSCPLLIVPANCIFEGLKKVVYASDYKTEDVDALKDLIELTQVSDSKITILHVSDDDSDENQEIFSSFRDLFEDKLKKTDLEFAHVVNKNTAQGIDEYMRKNNAELLVLLTQRYSLFQKLFHTSTTKNMSFVATYPVLVSHGSILN